MQPQTLDFASFIREYFKEYQIDKDNTKLINHLGLWAIRTPAFEKPEEGRFLDKGILISGNVGSGKTELMRVLRFYLSYLKSPYGYTSRVVWKFAETFADKGYSCFQNAKEECTYYDELCLTDEDSGIPIKEYASYYGTKVMVGKELIMSRYNLFKRTGIQSHFTTNVTFENLLKIYGERAFSRLREMCNFFTLVGSDKRVNVRPAFYQSVYQAPAPKPKEVSNDEVIENKKRLNEEFQIFIQEGKLSEFAAMDYYLLKFYGAEIATDDELRVMMEIVQANRKEQVMSNGSTAGSPRRVEQLRRLYEHDELDKDEQDFIWEQTRRHAVMAFFQKLKDASKTFVFDMHTN